MTTNYDRTNEKEARWMITHYSLKQMRVVARYYFHEYRKAQACFDELTSLEYEEGTSINLDNMKKDSRKAHKRY